MASIFLTSTKIAVSLRKLTMRAMTSGHFLTVPSFSRAVFIAARWERSWDVQHELVAGDRDGPLGAGDEVIVVLAGPVRESEGAGLREGVR